MADEAQQAVAWKPLRSMDAHSKLLEGGKSSTTTIILHRRGSPDQQTTSSAPHHTEGPLHACWTGFLVESC